MSGAAYWAEREAAKAAALRMAAKLSVREKGTVALSVKRSFANDAEHDNTLQRKFERGFISLDSPDEDGRLYDYGDCGREMRKMLRDLDGPYREHVREQRFAAALDALDGHPELQRTLRAIRRHRERRQIAAALGIPPETYAKRFTRICQILAPLLA